MSKQPVKKKEVKEIVLSFLKNLYEKKLHGTAWSQDELNIVSQKNSLIAYVQEQLKEQPSCGDVSDNTIYKAITELVDQRRITYKDHEYLYVPTESEEQQNFPILNIAKDISIQPLPFKDFCLFETNEKYTRAVADYLGSQFSNDDIRVIPIGNFLLCLDLELPAGSSYFTKKRGLNARVSDYLKRFTLKVTQADDNSIEGLTAEQYVEEIAMLQSVEEEPEYGGKIDLPNKRSVKKS